MYNKNIGFTIGKFAPLHKGHQLLIETALKEMDELYVVIYDTDIISVDVKQRANWIKQLYPDVHIIYAYNSPQKYGLDDKSVKIQMEYLSKLIKDIPVTHFYSSELYGEKVADYLNISSKNVHAYIMGEHGDSSFVPWEHAYVGCKKIYNVMQDNSHPMDDLDKIHKDVVNAAY